jgi:hypothetical protein
MNHDKVGSGPRLRIRADNRKGQLQLVRSPEGMMNLQWRDRSSNSGNTELNLDLFPGDVTFKRIKTGREAERVYELQFVHATERRFFLLDARRIC